MKLLLINDADETVDEAFLGTWVDSVTAELRKRGILEESLAGKELSVVLLKEMDAKQLNWNFRQKDYATDVLSFETEDPESLGELVLCPMVLRKQAHEHKQSFEHETGYMILHGILHLLGYDHEKSEEDADEMLGLQDEIFALLTAPPPAPKKKTAAPAAKAKKAPAAKKPAAKAKAPAKKSAKTASPKKKAAKRR